MTRPIVRRSAAAFAAGGFAAAVGLAPALPALAHGAPVQPISRTAACAAGSDEAGTAACKAARAANGQAFGSFDNLRVPGVNGNDKQTIPDGKLCSGDLPEFKGLDLPRDDYPATKLTAGATFKVVYRATIPHEGSFRVYLTKPGYDPTEPLGWDDLSSKPILTADNPPLTDGAYRFSGKLPSDRSGRHLLYTVWQTTSTPDTYYSCSDVVLKPAAGAAAAQPRPSATKKPVAKKSTASASPSSPAVAPVAKSAPPVAPAAQQGLISPVADEWKATLGRRILTTALIVIVGVSGTMAFLRIRRARGGQTIHRRP